MNVVMNKLQLMLLLIPLPLIFLIIGAINFSAGNETEDFLPPIIIGLILSIIGIAIFIAELKKLKKNPHPFTYIVNKDTLVAYMKANEKFSFDKNLEASYNYNLYLNGNKIHVQMWNYAASDLEDEKAKGVVYYYGDKEYRSLDEMINAELSNLPIYFKIELIDSDDELLNEFKKNHPELKIEDYS